MRHLITPAFSGIYLSRYTIGQLARQLELPRGFGNREQMLLNLMRTAVQYDNLKQLLAILQEKCTTWAENYQLLQESYPKIRPFTTQWQQRAKATIQLLEQMADATDQSNPM